MKHALLLRGINVGGHRKVAMARLREELGEVGGIAPRTYLQSGNVVIDAADADAAVRRVRGVLSATFGLDDVPIVTRDGPQLAAIVAANPFVTEASAEPAKVHVVFLHRPAEATAELDPDRSPGDRWHLDGQQLYVHYANGQSRTKLDHAYIERTLGVAGTARNWNTVAALAAMTE